MGYDSVFKSHDKNMFGGYKCGAVVSTSFFVSKNLLAFCDPKNCLDIKLKFEFDSMNVLHQDLHTNIRCVICTTWDR